MDGTQGRRHSVDEQGIAAHARARTDFDPDRGRSRLEIAQIAAAGKVAGTLCRSEHVERFVGLGARLLYVSLDDWIRSGAGSYREQVTAASR